jgi:NADPH:quinone reductase-like Zn-dependent oxidoreductase|eukprot:m.14409 g.14409  ORF g.14409 m.14409 type:complete len:331 (+) comp10113_c0_seq1:216-1208(+)
MQAVQITDYVKDVGAVKLTTVSKPIAVPGHAVVRIHFAAVNPIDVAVAQGYLAEVWPTPLPLTIGYDFSGVIDSLDVVDQNGIWKTGTDVFAVNWGVGSHSSETSTVGGAFAEYILAPLSRLSTKPANISHEQAAASALVASTAYQIVNDCAAVTEGQKILILGGPASVGSFACQFAKRKGAYVATTSSTRNLEFTKSLGVDRVVNYTTEKWSEIPELKGFDAVIDTVGEPNALETALENGVLKPDGRFVTIANPTVGYDPTSHVTLKYAAMYALKNDPATQDMFAARLASGELKFRLDKQFPFTQEGVSDMMKYQANGKPVGKNTLKIV